MHRVFETIGGEVGIASLTSIVYQRLTTAPELEVALSGLDPVKLRNRLDGFFSAAFGGPVFDGDWETRLEHSGLRLDDRSFDLLLENIIGTLRGLGVDSATLGRVRDSFERYRERITGREGEAKNSWESPAR